MEALWRFLGTFVVLTPLLVWPFEGRCPTISRTFAPALLSALASPPQTSGMEDQAGGVMLRPQPRNLPASVQIRRLGQGSSSQPSLPSAALSRTSSLHAASSGAVSPDIGGFSLQLNSVNSLIR